MDSNLLIAVVAGVVGALLTLGAVFFFLSGTNSANIPNNTATIAIDGIALAKVQNAKDLEIDWKDESSAQRLVALKNNGMLFTFQSCEFGSKLGKENNYRYAFEKTLKEISMFLKSSVSVLTNYIKINNQEFYNRASTVLSESITSGSKPIVKYSYFDQSIPGHFFCVITLYDPEAALKVSTVQNKLKALAKEWNIDWEEFNKSLQEAFKNVYSSEEK